MFRLFCRNRPRRLPAPADDGTPVYRHLSHGPIHPLEEQEPGLIARLLRRRR